MNEQSTCDGYFSAPFLPLAVAPQNLQNLSSRLSGVQWIMLLQLFLPYWLPLHNLFIGFFSVSVALI